MATSAQLLMTDSKDSSSATAGSSTGSYLIPRTLYGELIRAVRKKLILRALVSRVIGPSSIPGSSIDITLQSADSMGVYHVTEGEEIPLDAEAYTGFNLKPKKYGVRIMISKEMIEDSSWDVMGLNVATAGYEMADNEEALIVSTLSAGAAASTSGNNSYSPSSAFTVSACATAMQYLEAYNHTATHIICGVEVVNDIRGIDTFTEADKAGINDPSKRLIGTIFGAKVLVSNNVSAKLAYFIDVDHALIGAEKRPLTIEKYFDAGRDSGFAVATQRIAYRYLRPDAIVEMTTT